MLGKTCIKKIICKVLVFFSIFLVSCAVSNTLKDGEYLCEVSLSGGSGKASIESPCSVIVKDGAAFARIVWSSSNYDYMLVKDNEGVEKKILNEAATGENSSFTIPVPYFDREFSVIADTTAMSTSHEIEYSLKFWTPGTVPGVQNEDPGVQNEDPGVQNQDQNPKKPALTGLTKVSEMPLLYTKGFSVEHFEDENKQRYSFITIADGDMSGETTQYILLAPDGKGDEELLTENKNNNPGLTVIYDTEKTYLVSGQAMDPVVKLNALQNIAFSGKKKEDWSILEAADAMGSGDILYAGKYSAPDFELLVSKGCGLSIENTMIYHNPKIKEKLESLGIPVLVERSGYEDDPLGRLEWVKLYGALFDREEEAKKLFDSQVERIEELKGLPDTGKSVAVFSIDSKGKVSIRRPGDYISRMIEIAGGKYLPDGPLGNSTSSTVKLSMEDFFLKCESADILIYNSTISGEIEKKADLLAKSEVIKNMKAFKEGSIYCLSSDYYEMAMSTADFITDVRKILSGEKEGLKFLKEVAD
ncbi:MAG: ABC transporter substrate-binding protein [Lachnospiraceae bacterium]|nr:ABC transporter substrate-binding protein [Lachnospiraceae bacterium]